VKADVDSEVFLTNCLEHTPHSCGIRIRAAFHLHKFVLYQNFLFTPTSPKKIMEISKEVLVQNAHTAAEIHSNPVADFG